MSSPFFFGITLLIRLKPALGLSPIFSIKALMRLSAAESSLAL